jgi:enoyl-CoA hydratase/carnithine racemase
LNAKFETLAIERQGRVAILRINRPDKKNAMSPTFFRELPRALEELDRSGDTRAVVLTGSGDAFSAGGDIESFDRLKDLADYRAQLQLVENAFHSIERAELPVIAAVNGIAYGGGTEIILFCDFVVASEQARFAFREIRVGLQPGYGLVRAPATIGAQWTKYLALTGNVIDAQKALAIGLVQELTPHADLLPKALEIAQRIAANPAIAVRVGKRFVNRHQGADGLRETLEPTALLFSTPDHKEGVSAFLQKREPRFS